MTVNMSKWKRWMAGAVFGCTAGLFAGSASAQDLQVATGTSALGSTWRGDFAMYGSLKLSARFAGVVGPYVQGSVGYGLVDQRMLTLISLGGQVWLDYGKFRPHARIAFSHQHEESLSVVANDFGSAIFGIGDGIRHRAGGELGLGVDIEMWRRKQVHLFVGIDGTARLFPDELGPLLYAGGGVSAGFNWSL